MKSALRWYAFALLMLAIAAGFALLGAYTAGAACLFAAVLSLLCALDEHALAKVEADMTSRDGGAS